MNKSLVVLSVLSAVIAAIVVLKPETDFSEAGSQLNPAAKAADAPGSLDAGRRSVVVKMKPSSSAIEPKIIYVAE